MELLKKVECTRYTNEDLKREGKFESVKSFVQFCDASSSGKFLYVDYLPEELRAQAVGEIWRECETLRSGSGEEVAFWATQSIWIARKGEDDG